MNMSHNYLSVSILLIFNCRAYSLRDSGMNLLSAILHYLTNYLISILLIFNCRAYSLRDSDLLNLLIQY
jgi:hypothetical protein